MGLNAAEPRNHRGRMLAEFCEERHLFIANTFFKKKLHRRWTWMNDALGLKKEIDHVLVRNIHDVRDVGVLSSVNTGSDHRLVRCTLHLTQTRRITRPYRGTAVLDKRLLQTFARTQLQSSPLHGDVNEDYVTLTRIINSSTDHATSLQPLPPRVSERTRQLFQLRRVLQYGEKSKFQAVEYAEICKLVRKSLKEDLRTRHLAIFCKAVQSGQFRGGRKELVYARRPRTLLCLTTNRTSSSCSDPLTETMKTVKSFYDNLYHSSHGPQQPPSGPICIRLSPREVEEALKNRKTRSSPGSDRVLSSSLRPLCTILANPVCSFINKIFETKVVPDKLAFAEMILLYKSGDPTNVANYRPISLLSTIYKVITKALNTRLEKAANDLAILPQEQAGFRKRFSTVHHIHTLNMLLEKSHGFNIPAYAIFIDFKKAFDTVELPAVWQALESFDVDDNLIKAIQPLYANGSAAVKIEEYQTELNIQRGVRQGDPLSPLLFTITLQYALNTIDFRNRGFRIDGKRLPFPAYADDIVLLSNDRNELENMALDLSKASEQIGLTINFEKTKWMKLNNTIDIEEELIEGQTIERVREYVYLGQVISQPRNQLKEIRRRIQAGRSIFFRHRMFLKSRSVALDLKRKFVNTCILPAVLYGCETWTWTKETALTPPVSTATLRMCNAWCTPHRPCERKAERD
ncbi:hypothetical protein Y032_0012g1665 [Ancylostoma ceylanicum]|uniref:Reverse transcriptase domain-containing protein n=1 Tax=Ancylostoma ceylanicum TaxID=53326 RepID=A0A016VCU0_9BILA|nr:hypothetical protein Y032_0012g1665 [Ancylostoma ceylanicum]